MRRAALVLAVASLLLVAAPAFASGAAVDATGPELVSSDGALDGSTVRFTGEVISEPLAGGDGHVWVNVLADGTAIGVWTPRDLAEGVEVFGRYSHTGDVVRVTGVLNETCEAHGGDLDVHAQHIEIIKRGERREHPADWWKLGAGLAGLLAAYAGWRRMRRLEEGSLSDRDDPRLRQ
ncbi:MAG: DNA-binding protein [Aeromicrobium sp.]|nr:DNA-binding protein [Aeromicrobium sp.]